MQADWHHSRRAVCGQGSGRVTFETPSTCLEAVSCCSGKDCKQSQVSRWVHLAAELPDELVSRQELKQCSGT